MSEVRRPFPPSSAIRAFAATLPTFAAGCGSTEGGLDGAAPPASGASATNDTVNNGGAAGTPTAGSGPVAGSNGNAAGAGPQSPTMPVPDVPPATRPDVGGSGPGAEPDVSIDDMAGAGSGGIAHDNGPVAEGGAAGANHGIAAGAGGTLAAGGTKGDASGASAGGGNAGGAAGDSSMGAPTAAATGKP